MSDITEFTFIPVKKSLSLLLSRERKYTDPDKSISTNTIAMEWTREDMEKVATETVNSDEWRDYVVADVKESLDSLQKDDQQTIVLATKKTDEYTDILILHPATYKSPSGWVHGQYSIKPISND